MGDINARRAGGIPYVWSPLPPLPALLALKRPMGDINAREGEIPYWGLLERTWDGLGKVLGRLEGRRAKMLILHWFCVIWRSEHPGRVRKELLEETWAEVHPRTPLIDL